MSNTRVIILSGITTLVLAVIVIAVYKATYPDKSKAAAVLSNGAPITGTLQTGK